MSPNVIYHLRGGGGGGGGGGWVGVGVGGVYPKLSLWELTATCVRKG